MLLDFSRAFFQKVRENSSGSYKTRYFRDFYIEIWGDLANSLNIFLIFARPPLEESVVLYVCIPIPLFFLNLCKFVNRFPNFRNIQNGIL